MKPQIVKFDETTTTANGRTVPAIKVTFKVGEHGPFSEIFPKDTFSAATVNQKLGEFVMHLQQIAQ